MSIQCWQTRRVPTKLIHNSEGARRRPNYEMPVCLQRPVHRALAEASGPQARDRRPIRAVGAPQTSGQSRPARHDSLFPSPVRSKPGGHGLRALHATDHRDRFRTAPRHSQDVRHVRFERGRHVRGRMAQAFLGLHLVAGRPLRCASESEEAPAFHRWLEGRFGFGRTTGRPASLVVECFAFYSFINAIDNLESYAKYRIEFVFRFGVAWTSIPS